MISTDTPDLVLTELKDKHDNLRAVVAIAFGTSGVVTAPVWLVLRKSGLLDGLAEGLTGEGMHATWALILVNLVAIYFLFSIVAKPWESKLIPWLYDRLVGNYQGLWKPRHFSRLSPAEAIGLAPIIKGSQPPIDLVKLKLGGDNDRWTVHYNSAIKYFIMSLSFLLVAFVFAVLARLILWLAS